MMKQGFMLLGSYLKRGTGMMLTAAVFAGISLFIFMLYDLPLEGLGYTLVICLVVGLIYGMVGFADYVRRIRSIPERAAIGKKLPEPRDALEQTYQEVIGSLGAEKDRAILEADLTYQELVEYYTMWAHQIKTPIAAMRLLLQSEESAQNTQMEVELFRIEQYVEMVLSYLRIDSPTSDLVLRTYPLDDIVRRAVRKYSLLFIRKKIKLDFSELKTEVLTDEKWLQFVVEQLLSNAIKYTPEGGTIRISCIPDKIMIIEDNGIGISAEDLPRVFEKGYTGYNGRGGRKSTGIGLYLCRKVIHKLGHTIRLESELGRYTRALIGLSTVHLNNQICD